MFVVNLANKRHLHIILDSINLPVVDAGRFVKLFSRGRHFDPDCSFGEILALVLNFLIGIDDCVVLRLGPCLSCALAPVSMDWPSHLLVNVRLLGQGSLQAKTMSGKSFYHYEATNLV
jgi:hypothetical protein